MGLLLGFIFVVLLGIAHHDDSLAIRAVEPNSNERPQTAIFGAFIGLFALHTLEIDPTFAVAYRVLLGRRGLRGLNGSYDATWGGLIYFSGINFATLGYTQIVTSGPIRMSNI